MPHNLLRHLITDLSLRPTAYKIHTPSGPIDLDHPPTNPGRSDTFTLTGPAGIETFVVGGPRAYGRGGSFNLGIPADRYLLTQTVHPSTLSQSGHLSLHTQLDDAGFILTTGKTYHHLDTHLTPLTARHSDGRLLWFSETRRQSFGLPLEHYLHYGSQRIAALRYHETPRTVKLMALTDIELRARGVNPSTLPALLLVSAWTLREETLDAILQGEVPEAAFLPPADFEWNPTAYQQLHLSLTREDIQRQANKATLARPA
ncbi:hypothetical protein GCM10008955_33080 [Deinococcus malanensis]|uniref:Urease accessory protein UreD n=1 Tax=Deinococcus malanensis TaxID=1706855 RepID=A0ABQ2F0B1_9DEIO|nr:hypothetical protein [Deinococcus malanensis]GGK36655.1 hypothetical protein GCM10008955_33080 [Deinococcus malanensis]